MKILPGELSNHGYILLDSMTHKELVPFVRTYIRKRTRMSLIYTFSNVIMIVMIIFWIWKAHATGNVHSGMDFRYLFYGFLLTFALIPIHEYIHVLAYKAMGAEKTSYDANWKKFYFLAIADQFVANKREFQIVALAPFIIISSILIICLFFSTLLGSFAILGMLFTHTAFTSGDFALLSYFDFHRDKEILTYDDRDKGITYFYGKTK